MSNPGSNLPVPYNVEAQLERMAAGGLIRGAIGGPEQSMDRMIGGHLANVAMLESRGDKSPERPFYIFNPDTNLLINYSFRRNEDPTKSGLFADIVELDESGAPRHGVGVINPFATSTGFINVAIGDNEKGFTPSYTEMKLDSDDPLQTVPPNLETADLLALLGQGSIAEDEELADYIHKRSAEREEFRNKVYTQQARQQLGTVQAFHEFTNPDLHLVISTREDPSALAAASREVGLYPLVISGNEAIRQYTAYKALKGAPDHLGESIPELLRHAYPELSEWVMNNSVSIVTVDLAPERRDELGHIVDIVNIPKPNWGIRDDQIQWADRPLTQEVLDYTNAILSRSRIFARLMNPMLHPEYNEEGLVEKVAHGDYLHTPDPEKPKNMAEYTDWLRKVKLDMALTLYLRGLNQIG